MDEKLSRLGSAIVTVMQPAESLVRNDPTGGWGASSAVRRSLPQPQMRAVVVIVVDIISEQPFQMASVHRNDVIQQVSSAAFDSTLRDPVLPRTLERGLNRIYLHGSHSCRNFQAVLGVTIKDQESGSQVEREGLPQLLNNPPAGGMFRDIEMQDTPSVVADNEEAVEYAEGDRRDREEVHRSNRFTMVAQEREPSLGGFRISRCSAHPTRNSSFGNVEAEHEKFTMNPRRAPCRILGNHSEDRFPNFFRRRPSPGARPDFRDQPPVQTKTDQCQQTTVSGVTTMRDCFHPDQN